MGRLMSAKPRLMVGAARVAQAPKVALPFYRTPEWPALVASLIKLRGRKCQDCGASGCRIYGDHVVELKDGGAALDPENVRLRCASCHGTKTAKERARRSGIR